MTDLTLNSSPEEVREAWAAALESGEYEQGMGKLCRVDDEGNRTYCCLGVLTEMYRLAGGAVLWKSSESQGILASSVINGYEEEENYLVGRVQRWAGLFSHIGWYQKDGDMRGSDTLANRNDNGATFEEIAEIIRSEKVAG